MKKHTSIPFLELESIPLLIKDFLMKKVQGYEDHILSADNLRKQLSAKEKTFLQPQRQLLYEVLATQHANVEITEKQHTNLEDLRSPDTFTVTTGHQLNLFTGPVFFIYKILQTIRLADDLSRDFPDKKVVPVFWMASEDHDFEEINHFKTENGYYEIKAKSGGAVGEIIVVDDFFISAFGQEFSDTVFGTELVMLMKKAYKKGHSLAVANRILVQELFGDYGLLMIDGNDARLKKQLIPTFRDELLHQKLAKTTKSTVESLIEQYGKVQVNPRDINLFYLNEERNRIECNDGNYSIVDQPFSFTEEEILQELHAHPEKFSPNALMRPVFQETVLPNLAYIGGNAEMMYWLQLKPYFDTLALPFPVLVPRNSLLFVTEKTLSKVNKLGLQIEDFFKNFALVTKNLLLEDNEILALLQKSEEVIDAQFQEIMDKAATTDPSFGTLVDAEKTRQLKSFHRMRKRLLRAEKIKQQEKLQRLENLFLTIHPGKTWQERVYNFAVFYADHGRDWLQTCYQQSATTAPELIIVSI